MDFFVVPTIGFNLLYVLVIVQLIRRELVWLNVTAHPTAESIAQQITEAFPWTEALHYLMHDRDAIYGTAVTRQLRAMGINTARTHRSLNKDAPVSRPVQRIGRIVSHARVGGLHHQYVRI
jgi:hypothetical protein